LQWQQKARHCRAFCVVGQAEVGTQPVGRT